MKNRSRNTYLVGFVLVLFVLSSFFFYCGKSEEDTILETVDKIGDYTEDRDMDGLLDFISADYSDDEERTYADIEELVKKHFDRSRGIVVNVLVTKITTLAVPEAELETELALSSGAAKLFRKAVRYSGRFYRFRLSLVKEGEVWRCKKAHWEQIYLHELFPESVKLMKKLFPNLF
ncbi:MAG: hypothetical protein KAW12_06950 [Candidatus Aminicenantes bacterium]|nr:hypothetical protein [Candidatus Aminicenantes bacterium]